MARIDEKFKHQVRNDPKYIPKMELLSSNYSIIILVNLEQGQPIFLRTFDQISGCYHYWSVWLRVTQSLSQLFHLDQAAELLEAHQNTPLCSLF